MGDRGMHDMAEMEMPLPDNTLPMMTGQGPFGPVGMGGMFSVVKVRDDLPQGVYRDPGPYRHPPGTGARKVDGTTGPEPRRHSEASTPTGQTGHPGEPVDPGAWAVRKPDGHAH